MADLEGFGDFNFFSSAATMPPQSASADDDWGDFVAVATPPVKTHAGNGFAPAPADSFGFFRNGPAAPGAAQVESDPSPNRVEAKPDGVSKTKQWEKPKGALPLSLFGEEEEKKDEQANEDLTGLTKNDGFGIKGSNLNRSGSGIDDLISNLYVQNGSGLNSGSGGADLSSNGLKFEGADLNGSSNLKLNVEEGNGDVDEDEDEDDGWEFKAAEPERGVGSENAKESNRGTGFSGGFGIHEFNNGSVASNGTPHGGEWGFSFDIKPSSVSQDNFFFETYSESKPTNDANVSNYSRVDDNGWEFKDALSETGSEHKLEEAKAANPAGLEWHVLDGAGAGPRNDFFSGSDWISHPSSESNFAFPFIPNSDTRDVVILDSYSNGKKDDIATGLSSTTDNNHVESDDNFWEFKDAFSESGSMLEGESVVASNSPANTTSSAMDGENHGLQHSEVMSRNHRQALPLSIFGDEELETDTSSVHEDISTQTAASHQINTARSPATNVSITDFISSLYSQVEQDTPKTHIPKEIESTTTHPVTTMLESDFVGDDGDDDGDDGDDDSWEFKDAVSKDQNSTSIANVEDSLKDTCTQIQVDDFVEFYCKLKDESYFLALYHLDQNKKAQSSASFSGVDATEALDKEIQKLYDDLPQDKMRSDQFQSGNSSPRNSFLNELHKALGELKFQVLESEYQLSQRLSLAEKDMTSAIELLRHAASILRILRLGSMEEQSRYIAVWSQMVSICAEELKHGSLIWRQSLEKNVQKQMLSEPRGKQYIIALGEMYRVVLVLRASTKLYSPWILLQSDCSSLIGLLNQCYTLWSSSGLDEALRSISDKDDFKYDENVNALLDSLNSINHLDAFSLQDHFLSGQQALCSLSLLSAGAVPGIKMVVWNDQHYLLTLANLWINLIGGDPPQLPHFSFS
ncbi:uncharacterized protein LOC126797994 isoform X2 [Argentina anserina]|uniref:uncharacterized protein LOC126797994 isoform X2 n=1 Tax=Argentina anserina TaxID=57926 RepID=UPI00217640AE|nr:uncharacterized protein LOC126797994 isoform X2 [Potentilla anserina]